MKPQRYILYQEEMIEQRIINIMFHVIKSPQVQGEPHRLEFSKKRIEWSIL